MSLFSYLVDIALILLVLLQIKERPLTTVNLVRPLIVVAIAVFHYLHGIPTGGNDLVLIVALAVLGALIGVASGLTAVMRVRDGVVTSRSGLLSAFFWVLGMGSRFGFLFWVYHGGRSWLTRFSIHHSVTNIEAWTVALLAMAVLEVIGRIAVQVVRSRLLERSQSAANPA